MRLTPRQEQAVAEAQRAMRDSLKRAYPEPTDHALLFVCAVTSSFASLVHGDLGSQLMNIINAELNPANLMLARARGFGSPGHPLGRKRA
jgi:hypothetical protein